MLTPFLLGTRSLHPFGMSHSHKSFTLKQTTDPWREPSLPEAPSVTIYLGKPLAIKMVLHGGLEQTRLLGGSFSLTQWFRAIHELRPLAREV